MVERKNEVSIEDFVSKCDQIRSFLQIWSHLLKKSLIENFIFCAVSDEINPLRVHVLIFAAEFWKALKWMGKWTRNGLSAFLLTECFFVNFDNLLTCWFFYSYFPDITYSYFPNFRSFWSLSSTETGRLQRFTGEK